MRRRLVPLLVLTAALLQTAAAETGQRVLRVMPFSGDALSAGETTALQNLITSYVAELRAFRVIDTEGQELALKEAETAVQLGVPKNVAPLAADYLLSGDASKVGGIIVFTLDLTTVSSGEKRSVSDTASSVNELILESRRLTRSLFAALTPPQGTGAADFPAGASVDASGAAPESGQAALTYDSSPRLDEITGAWKGDKGLDRISIFSDGRGIAILESGASMRIRASIEGAKVIVTQDQKSIPDYYRSPGLGYEAAKQIAEKARPWRWVFALSSAGDRLIGVKESVFVRVDASGTVAVDNNYVRDSAWTRLFR
ncbi:MAG: hypothetical protein M0Z80_04620 [Treponema sp.]|nr:hypothetical protein [Treponema sp.]